MSQMPAGDRLTILSQPPKPFDPSPTTEIGAGGTIALLTLGTAVLFAVLVVRWNSALEPKATADPTDGFVDRLDSPHRLFTICAGLWAFIAPLVMETERCPRGSVRGWVSDNITGYCVWRSGSIDATDFFSIVIVCGLVPVVAYLTIFVAGPRVLRLLASVGRWVAAGNNNS